MPAELESHPLLLALSLPRVSESGLDEAVELGTIILTGSGLEIKTLRLDKEKR